MKMNNLTGIWQYVKNYRFNSIFIKNLIMILLLIELPLAGLSISMYVYYNNNTSVELAEANKSSLMKIRDLLDMAMQEADKLSIRIISSDEVNSFFAIARTDVKRTDFSMIDSIEKINRILSQSFISEGLIDSVFIYNELRNYLITTTMGSSELSTFKDIRWFNIYNQNKGKYSYWANPISLENKYAEKPIQNFISIFRTYPISSSPKEGMVMVNINADKLHSFISNTGSDKTEQIFIVDNNGSILYSQDYSLLNQKFTSLKRYEKFSLPSDGNYMIYQKHEIKEVISNIHLKYNDWNIISIVPLSKFEQKLNYLKNYMIVTVSVNILLAIFVSFFISTRVFDPIKKIMQLVQNPESWITDSKSTSQKKINELIYISSNFIGAVDKNRKMEIELAERMERLKIATSVALQAQINPHFLYNTLENIRWKVMALTGGQNEGSDMINSLSRLLRLSLETSESIIPIGKEIEHASLYLSIQSIRYEDIIEVLWKVPEELLSYKTVKLTLQPIIENSIYHGIKPKNKKCLIQIIGEINNSTIELCIIDDGVGMTQNEVDRINSGLQMDYIKENEHIGLSNVNQRIKFSFGDGYGLSIKSEEGKGTEVKIVIPKIEA